MGTNSNVNSFSLYYPKNPVDGNLSLEIVKLLQMHVV